MALKQLVVSVLIMQVRALTSMQNSPTHTNRTDASERIVAAWLHEYARVVRVCARMRGSCTAYQVVDGRHDLRQDGLAVAINRIGRARCARQPRFAEVVDHLCSGQIPPQLISE